MTWVLAALPCVGGAAQEAPPGAAGEDYLREVKPILRERCFACHGALKQKGKLRVDTVAALLRGGAGGPAVLPGNAAGSLLLRRLTDPDPESRMPQEAAPLSAQDISRVRRWIEAGAQGPADEAPEQPPSAHWAFRAPRRPKVPAVKDASEVRTPVDAFLAAAQERRGARPAGEAPRDVLLRRVTLDLVGVPPTREELHAFRADGSPDAYERVVERLLARPQHGERWGRHWMDVWRYSDWYGVRSQNDVRQSYAQIWRWRDWIVRSLNQDKGYDRMIVEMLAADEVAPEDDETIVATGFLVRNWYAWNHNQWMRDLVEHTGKAFLGLTLNCAHCHDHKYDPITQEDYFRFRAFFEPLQLRHGRVPGEPDPGPFKKYVYEAKTAPIRSGLVRVYDEKLDAPTYLYAGGDERNRLEGRPPVSPGPPVFLAGGSFPIEPVVLPPTASYPGLREFVRKEEADRRRQAVAEARAFLAKADAGARPRAEARLEAAEADLSAVHARLAADSAREARVPGAPEMAAAAARAERLAAYLAAKARLLDVQAQAAEAEGRASAAEGDKAKKEAADAQKKAAAAVTAGQKALDAARKALESGSDEYTPFAPKFPGHSTGRRRALALWIASPANPLTARVAVNHVWMRHFGQPLVESVFDFGRNGKPPTHPELLDWLAAEFMESGWSLKHLHRVIVRSGAYRRAPGPPDPDLRHFPERRLEAEAVRDSILAAAGELDPALGGADLPNTPEHGSRRRSLYFSHFAEDGGHMKFLELFDAADPSDAYRRHGSITPQQALALTNSRLVVDQSRRLARRVAAASDAEFVTAAYEQVLSRAPSPAERAACEAFLRRQEGLFRASPVPAAVKDSVEPSPDPASRARESLVRALFSHHDFVTIR
jgi:hypothetical protein